MSHLQLQRTLNFTVDDLRENREGRLSEKQREKFKPPQMNPLAFWVLIGHGVFIVALLGSIAIITNSFAAWVVLVIVIGLGILPFLVMRNEGNVTPLLRSDYESGKLKQACGILILTEKQGRQPHFELYVDGITMKITTKEAAAFINEELYCVYYLPRSLKLISAEPAHS